MKSQKKGKKIKVRQINSDSAGFKKRPLPSEKEEEKEEAKERKKEKQQREKTISSSLSEIYQDGKGGEVNVKKIEKKKKGGLIFWFFNFIFLVLVLLGVGAGVFYYFSHQQTQEGNLDFSIKGKKEVKVNQEFFYEIKYKNKANFSLNEVRINADYPKNFVFLDSFPKIDGQEGENNFWNIKKIPPHGEGVIRIKGKIIDKEKESAVFLSKINYTPANFSSEFSKEASFSTNLRGSGLNIDIDHPDSVLVGEEESLTINFNPETENYLKDFILELKKGENVEIINTEAISPKEEKSLLNSEKLKKDTWNLSFSRLDKTGEWKIDFIVKEKKREEESWEFLFKQKEGKKEYLFDQKKITFETIKSDLDLNLIINGSQKNEPVSFGQTLNYSINYTNKGEAAMKDLTIMAVLESESLDWTTLKDEHRGVEKGHTITWTAEQIPKLQEVEVNQKGEINFSIEVISFPAQNLEKDFKIKSYAQFIVGGSEEEITATSTQDNRSNTIINKIKSDLKLSEEVRYFNEDNIPVGIGPLPPKVGEETTFKVYWELKNNLHELKNVKVFYELPEHVNWNKKDRTSVGSINYDSEKRKIIWEVGRLPLAIYQANAEFSISLTPQEEHKNKILVLSPGSTVKGFDTETEAEIINTTSAKTTKLEDDDIADESSDGRIE